VNCLPIQLATNLLYFQILPTVAVI